MFFKRKRYNLCMQPFWFNYGQTILNYRSNHFGLTRFYDPTDVSYDCLREAAHITIKFWRLGDYEFFDHTLCCLQTKLLLMTICSRRSVCSFWMWWFWKIYLATTPPQCQDTIEENSNFGLVGEWLNKAPPLLIDKII